MVLGCAGVAALAAFGAFWFLRQVHRPRRASAPQPPDREAWARAEFLRRYPGEKPLNWRLAAVAEEFHERKPMGKFVLHENDCSDFVACIVDEALGAGARFDRDSEEHLLGEDRRLTDFWYWSKGEPVQPGDVVSVRHSPWYQPYPGAIWHVGVVGADGYVYDFVKLKSWSRPRYGRNTFDWFIRHSQGGGQVRIWRLKAKYRYRISPVPPAGG